MTRVIPHASDFSVKQAQWPGDEAAIRRIREAVFVDEQGVPPELEWDSRDAQCDHVLAVSRSDEPVGTGRLLPDGYIGRMAVLPAWRGRGVGSTILGALAELARQSHRTEVLIHAQVHALAFYERHGFEAVGEEFMEAGIAHRKMRRLLTAK